jgi:hypothetical protein
MAVQEVNGYWRYWMTTATMWRRDAEEKKDIRKKEMLEKKPMFEAQAHIY